VFRNSPWLLRLRCDLANRACDGTAILFMVFSRAEFDLRARLFAACALHRERASLTMLWNSLAEEWRS
jgi:hypothetical protein